MAEDITGAQAVVRDLKELAQVSRESQGILNSDRAMVASGISSGGLSQAGRGSISFAGGTRGSMGGGAGGIQNIAEKTMEFRHAAKDIGETAEGLATGNLTKLARGVRGLGLLGGGGLATVVAARAISVALERISDIGDEYQNFYDVASGMEKTQTTTGIKANAGDIRDIMNIQRLREVGQLGGVDKYLQNKLGQRGIARDTVETLQSVLGFELITPMKELDKKAAERSREALEKAVDAIDKSYSAARLGNLVDAEKEDVKLIGAVGWGFAKKILADIGTPAIRFYHWDNAQRQARLWSKLESPRAGPRSDED